MEQDWCICLVPSIRLFLNETQEAIDDFIFNVTTFIDENERIISEIDELIAGLADIHERINSVSGTRYNPMEDLTMHVCRSMLQLYFETVKKNAPISRFSHHREESLMTLSSLSPWTCTSGQDQGSAPQLCSSTQDQSTWRMSMISMHQEKRG